MSDRSPASCHLAEVQKCEAFPALERSLGFHAFSFSPPLRWTLLDYYIVLYKALAFSFRNLPNFIHRLGGALKAHRAVIE